MVLSHMPGSVASSSSRRGGVSGRRGGVSGCRGGGSGYRGGGSGHRGGGGSSHKGGGSIDIVLRNRYISDEYLDLIRSQIYVETDTVV